MASCVAATVFRPRLHIRVPLAIASKQCRFQSSSAAVPRCIDAHDAKGTTSIRPESLSGPPLARLSTASILRSLLLSTFFTSPLLFKAGFAVFHKIANSQSPWLNPDRNPLLRTAVYPLIYKHFCAGRNKAEIATTSSNIRQLGFSGVILCYGREALVDADKFVSYDDSHSGAMAAEIDHWAKGNLETLNMIEQGDWLGIKFTRAGTHIASALMAGETPPLAFIDAMNRICELAASKGYRIWIDAEQQVLQASIDQWTLDFMRRYNKPERQALIYNTVQAYLKSSRSKVQNQLALAQKEGWRMGIKLVRGAYIATEQRHKIHDTKADTDASYNGIVHDLLCGNFPAMADSPAVELDLMLAGHNSETVWRATRLASDLSAQAKLRVVPEFAQLQGMADDIGCELLQCADDVQGNDTASATYVPRVYKCLTWGSIQECMQYLTRRLVENRGAADRMRLGADEFRRELLRRIGVRS